MEIKDKEPVPVNGLSPFIPVHPGEILGDELKARGIRQKDFAKAAGLQASHLSAIIHGVRTITPSVAQKIESCLTGISAGFWIKAQKEYNMEILRKKAKPSLLVAGYKRTLSPSAHVLTEPTAAIRDTVEYTIAIPEKDKDLLMTLARRFGWLIAEE